MVEDEDVKNADAKEKNADTSNVKSKDVKSKAVLRLKVRNDKSLSLPKKAKCKTKKKPKSQNIVTRKKKMSISLANVTNKFSIFGFMTEKEVEAITYSDSLEENYERKKCRRCNFKKYCYLNIIACTALHRSCSKCNKPGHYPKSKNCKATRKEKFKTKIKGKVASGGLGLKTNSSGMEIDTNSCKFIISPEVQELVEKRIGLIEKEISQSNQKENFSISPLRLRGGGPELPL